MIPATICQSGHRVGVAAIATAIFTMAPMTWASSTEYGKASAQMQEFQWAARLYHRDYGKYPVTDEDGTWYQKLLEGHYVSWSIAEATSGGSLPVDLGRNLFIYELPFGADAPLRENTIPILRWVGINGRDDQGKGDDIDLRYGVNYGYYYKAGYPYALGIHVFGLLLTIALIRPFFRAVKAWKLRLSILLLWLGTWTSAGGIIGSHGDYKDVAEFGTIGIFLGLTSCFATGLGAWIKRERRAYLRRSNLCVACKYDMRGSEGSICPECGHDQADG